MLVWWPRVQKSLAKMTLEHTRVLILRGALGATRTTLVVAIGVLLCVDIHLELIAAAEMTTHRFRCKQK